MTLAQELGDDTPGLDFGLAEPDFGEGYRFVSKPVPFWLMMRTINFEDEPGNFGFDLHQN
ncbi:MAG: hypothetical protein KF760_20255 [Candidatus Eremiobacteraeota bacterium]|nr:hypothetical protein [Candidatus Eremiobacteraeota bacterium]